MTIEDILKMSGHTSLNPVQKKSVEAGVLDGESVVVSAPTASGKSIHPSTNIIVDNSGNLNIVKIEDLFDSSKSFVINEETEAIIPKSLMINSLTPKGEIKLLPVDSILRHKAPKKLFKINLMSGREIICTGDHNQITIKNCITVPVLTSRLKIGNFIAIPRKIFLPSKNTKIDIVKNFADDTGYVEEIFAKKHGLSYEKLIPHAGISPEEKNIIKAIKNKDLNAFEIAKAVNKQTYQVEYLIKKLRNKRYVYSFSNKKHGIVHVFWARALKREPYNKIKDLVSVKIGELNRITKPVLKRNLKFIQINSSRTPDSAPIKVVWKLTKELSELLGYIISEGSVTTLAHFSNSNKQILKRVDNLLFNLFGIGIEHTTKYDYAIRSHAFVKFLSIFDILPFQNSFNKSICNGLFFADADSKKGFLASVIESEAEVRRMPAQLRITMASRDIINKISNMFLSFGIHSRTKKVFKRAANSSHKGNFYCSLSIYEVDKCYRLLKDYLTAKRKVLKESSNNVMHKHSNIDVIPIPSFFETLKNIYGSHVKVSKICGVSHDLTRLYIKNLRTPSRRILSKIYHRTLGKINPTLSKELLFVISSDVFWDKVIGVEMLDNTDYKVCKFVYDLTITAENSHNFICGDFGGIITHNTFIAEMAMLRCVLDNKKKAVYIVPLRALASEKYEAFKEKYEKLGIKIAVSVGDYDSSDQWLERYDVIIITSEKLDSLLRRNVAWISSVGLVVADEIHIIGDINRGPTMEVLLTKLKKLTNAQFVALSATIKNVREIADWLDAKAVESDYRPVKLYEGVYSDGKIGFFGKSPVELVGDELPEIKIMLDTTRRNKQALVFVATRKSAEATAERLSEAVKNVLSAEDTTKLEKLSDAALNALEYPTRQCERLAKCLAGGIAFHHAGLVSKQRKLIEDAFRNGLVKGVVATPTLAQGLNLPAYRVLIRDAKRFYTLAGWSYIPVLDYRQMSGRAGRPQYDTHGEAILIAKNFAEAEELTERYIMGETEEIYSKLASEPVLRVHVLALIASETCSSMKNVYEFFSRTFYGMQYGSSSELAEKIDFIAGFLEEHGFIVKHADKVRATAIGKRVSELYIDPETAVRIMKGIKNAINAEVDSSALIELATNTLEMMPYLPVKAGEFKELYARLNEAELLHKIPDEWDYGYENFLKAFKTSIMICDWSNETTEEQIFEAYGITPGELHNKIAILGWLFYSAQEIAILMGAKEIIKELRKTRSRVVYGIREELLPLVKLRDIGRFRARTLFNAGFTSVERLRDAPELTIAALIGPNIAKSVKKQLSGKEDKKHFEAKGLPDFTNE